jgi:5-oxoprolinase (ATP-hydrolysing) subunit C
VAKATFRVLEAGRSCIQDLGRGGLQRYGVPLRGSADQYSARLANALVLNSAELPLIEITALNFSLRAQHDLMFAVTGAECDIAIDGHAGHQWQPVPVARGSTLVITGLRRGLRCYLAVNGFISAPSLLGSVSPDPSLQFGWYLKAGDSVEVESSFTYFDHPHVRHPLMRPPVPVRSYTQPATIKFIAGPDVDQFTTPLGTLTRNEYEVGNQSDEIGLRLSGPAPARKTTTEILSRGVSIGSVEVTPSGDLLALLRGRMLTAGYPVIAVASSTAQSFLGQLQPGDRVGFQLVTIAEAVQSARDEREAIDGVAVAMNRIAHSLGLDSLRCSSRHQ